MPCASIEDVKQDAHTAVRNLPEAHASWQFAWRNARFRAAIKRLDKAYATLSVEGLNDQLLDTLERSALLVVKIVEIHISHLGGSTSDTLDRQYFVEVIDRLRQAASALSEGLSPNPANRPSHDALMDRFAQGLRRAKVAF